MFCLLWEKRLFSRRLTGACFPIRGILQFANLFVYAFVQTLAATSLGGQELTETMQKLLIVMQRLDEKIAPMLEADGEKFNKR